METVLPSSRFRSRKWFVFVFGLLIGLAFGLIEWDWYVGSMAAFSFWIILGLTAQARDIRDCYHHCTGLTSDERWGWRFAWGWRWAICVLIGFSFMARLLVQFHLLAVGEPEIYWYVSSVDLWEAVLLCSIIVAIASSSNATHRSWRRPWSWCLYVFCGFVAMYLFLFILEQQLLIPWLIHITIVGMLSAQPLQYSMEVVAASSSDRINEYHNIATAGVICLVFSCILLWQLSVWWRSSRWWIASCGILSAMSLTILVFLAARIVLVEFPTISPVMAAEYAQHPLTSLQWMAVIVLTVGLSAAIARRWAEPRLAGEVFQTVNWRRDETRYYHERSILLLPLGIVAVASCIVRNIDAFKKGWCMGIWGPRWLDTFLYSLINPLVLLSLVLLLLILQVTISQWTKRSNMPLTEQPQLAPGLFVLIWGALLMIIICSVPIISSWYFASMLRAGQYPGS